MFKNINSEKKRDFSWLLYIILIIFSLAGTCIYFLSQCTVQENIEKVIELDGWKNRS